MLFWIIFIYSSLANYSNPIIAKSLPDPTVIKASDGYFYLYTTEDIANVPIFRSKNLVSWTQVGTAFTDSTHPKFINNGIVWAPDINYINGKYVLYYSLSTWEDAAHAGIGVAVADKPEGPFKDLGKLFLSSEIGVTQSIDQVYFEENGHGYLIWGSYHGIYAIELASDGLSVKAGAEKRKVFGDIFEASIIHKRGKYYYYIGAWGNCCAGINSTYRVVGGRGTSLFGTYTDKSGKDLLNGGGYTVFIEKNSQFVGPGHTSKIVQDDAGNDWIFYHAISAKNVDGGRQLMMDRVQWDSSDWPYIQGGTPSTTSTEPVFK